MLRFLHTADLQLGMPFHWVPGDQGAGLRQARFDVIERLSALAAERGAAFIVVAGDFFDANDVEDRVIVQACERFRRARMPVFAIPGNHDHAAPGASVYLRRTFVEHCPPNLHLLLERDPRVVTEVPGLTAVLFPAPLRRRHEVGDTTTHLTKEAGRDLCGPGSAWRIGIAHGGVIDFKGAGGGDAVNLIAPDRAETAGLDYLALGDWHSTMRVSARTWYSGAPEPTGFDEPDSGNALVVTLHEPGTEPEVEKVRVARTRWVRHAVSIGSREDVDSLRSWFDGLAEPLLTLVRLEYEGTLPFSDLDAFEALLGSAGARLLHLRRRGQGVIPAATDSDLDAIASDGYVKTAVDRLRAQATGPGDEAAPALRALQILYRLSRRPEESRS